GERRLREERGRANEHSTARRGSAPGRSRDRQGARPVEPVRVERASQPRLPRARASEPIRAHPRRFLGGGRGPLRGLPLLVARAKPALEGGTSSGCRHRLRASRPRSSAGFAGATTPGGGVGGGAALSEVVGALGRAVKRTGSTPPARRAAQL